MADARAPRQTQISPRTRTPTRGESAPIAAPTHPLSRLQRSIGNRALGSLVQAKLRVGPADDHYEREADAVANTVMRSTGPVGAPREVASPETLQPCACGGTCDRCAGHDDTHDDSEIQRAAHDDHDTTVSRSAGDDPSDTPSDVELRLDATRGGGAPLPPGSRRFMESRFGYDFSSVRVHTDAPADVLNRDLNAYAFTAGTDVYFGAGQFQPGTRAGDHLLAHELTHVVQQNASVRRSPARASGLAVSPHSGDAAQRTLIQRRPFYFAPEKKPGGELVHQQVLPLFLPNNPGLFIEAPIPGASSKLYGIGKELTGRADFYTSEEGTATTIGIAFGGDDPNYLREVRTGPNRLRFAGGAYDHERSSAPRGADTTPHVRNLSHAPTKVSIGDLKPGASAEGIFGGSQVAGYQTGVKNTAHDVSDYLKKHPNESDTPVGAGKPAWAPSTAPLQSLHVPPTIEYPAGTHFPSVPLALWEETVTGSNMVLDDAGMRGRLYVYEDTIAGVYSYEWIPDNPTSYTGNSLVNTVLDRLNNDVIPHITAAPEEGVLSRKARTAKPPAVRTAAKPVVVQRAPKKFKDDEWERKYYNPWKTQAETFLDDKKAVKQARVAQALVEVEERSHKNIGLSDTVKTQGRGVDKIIHWKRWGGVYGFLREKFDFVFEKFHKMGKWVKDKIQKLMKSKAVSAFGSWVKAAAQVIFKIFKMLAAWTVRSVVDKLIASLTQGIANNFRKLVEMATPDGVKGKLEEFENLKAEYGAIVERKEEEISTFLFGDHLALFEKVEQFEEIANTLSTIVSLVEWGVRLIACASPPAIGCLWNLVISALQYAFALLMQTCWFTKKVYKPVIDNVNFVREFPTKVASKVVDVANKYIPYPTGFDPWFSPITQYADAYDPNCKDYGDGGEAITPEREAMLDLIQQVGPERVEAMMKVAVTRGAGPWVLLTADRVNELKTALKNADKKELTEAAADPAKPVPAAVEPFLSGIKQYTPREKQVEKEYFENKAKAEAAKKAAAGKGADSHPTGGKHDDAKSSGGGTGGGKGGVTVLDAKDFKKDTSATKPVLRPGIVARLVGGSAQHVKVKPDLVTADIFVDGVQRYRVQNIRVRGIFAWQEFSVPTTLHIVYYLEDGLQLAIDGQTVYWEQLLWADTETSATTTRPPQPQPTK